MTSRRRGILPWALLVLALAFWFGLQRGEGQRSMVYRFKVYAPGYTVDVVAVEPPTSLPCENGNWILNPGKDNEIIYNSCTSIRSTGNLEVDLIPIDKKEEINSE